MLIVHALTISDLSFLGAVNAYKSVVSILPGLVLLHELPTTEALAGIALIVGGSYFIVDTESGTPKTGVLVRFFSDRGVRCRLAALVLSAVEAVFLKRALNASSPLMTFAVWATAGFVLSLISAFLVARAELGGQGRTVRANWPSYFSLAITTGLMQFSTLVILAGFHVAAALALFQTSTLLTVLFGWRIFREKHFAKRLLGCLVMMIGAVLIILSR
jgi:drug/metabolite transporter (DMT)-like permease